VHDPDVVAFEIRRPWPTRSSNPAVRRWYFGRRRAIPSSPAEAEALAAGRDPFPWWKPSSWSPHWTVAGKALYFPPLITVWHAEPSGADSGEICKHYERYQDTAGNWQYKSLHGWRWHAHHWKIQVHPLQQLRRRLLTRCAWCTGRGRGRDQVNHSMSWDGPRGRWWQGEPGLYHQDCALVYGAHHCCVCEKPELEHGTYGRCSSCGKARAFGASTAQIDRMRVAAGVPRGRRDWAVYTTVCTMAAQDRAAR
jgi:hypothetical protein